MDDTNLIELNNEEKEYIGKIRNSYIHMKNLSEEIAKEIINYKHAFQDFLLSDESGYFNN